MGTRPQLRFLGTGAACGVPSYYCGCAACAETLVNPHAARTCACLLVSGDEQSLIDASPDLRLQLSCAGAQDIARVLLTHAHFDHIGGIPQLEFYVKLRRQQPVPLYGGKETLATVRQQFDFMAETLGFNEIEVWQALEFDGVRYTALPARHGQGAFGYLLETFEAPHNTARVAYFPDTGPLDDELIAYLASLNLDHFIVDATFNGNNWMPTEHQNIDSAIALAQRVNAKKTWLTHLAMHYDSPITCADLEKKLSVYGGTIEAAYDGLTLEL